MAGNVRRRRPVLAVRSRFGAAGVLSRLGRGIWQGKKPIAFERDFSAVQQKIFFPAGGGRSRASMRLHGWPWRGRCWFAYAPALLGLGWAVARARVPGALQDRRGNCVYYAGCFGG